MMDHDDFADYLLDDTIPQGKVITHIPAGAKNFINNNYEAVKILILSKTIKNTLRINQYQLAVD